MNIGKTSEPNERGFNWRKSPSHLLFLSTFFEPRSPNKNPSDIPWAKFLGEPPEQAIERLLKDKALRVCGTTQTLRHELPKLPIERLRELLQERGLPHTGKKDELVARLTLRSEPGLLLEFSDRYLLECSDLGKNLAENHLQHGLDAMVTESSLESTAYIKKVLAWLLMDVILTSITYDLLKSAFVRLWPDEPLPTPRVTLVPTPPDGTREPDKTPEPPGIKPGKTTQISSIYEPELVCIPAGYFWMGSADSDKEAYGDEKRQHRLYLPEYWITKYPITVSQFRGFVESTGYPTTAETQSSEYTWQHPRGAKSDVWWKGDHPVTRVSWQDAMAYCRWLMQVSGKRYTLPSEAEWEKAARGTDGRLYPWGDQWDSDRCNTSEGNKGDTTPVGSYSPGGDSPYGCADMSGNVWEWTRSLWGTDWDKPNFVYPYNSEDGREDLNASKNALRVLRGGSFYNYHWNARCACRYGLYPNYSYYSFGFRVVVSPSTLGSGRSGL